MSTAVKVILILLGTGVVLVLICCGGGYWFIKQNFAIQTSPADIRATLAEIADIEIPESFVPKQGMKMNFGVAKMKMVGFHTDSGGNLSIAEMTVPSAKGANEEQQIRQQMRQQNFGNKSLITKESETREFEIKGKKVSFEFAKAKDDQGNDYREVSGSFPGKEGTAVLMLQLPETDYKEDDVVKMIKSIH